MAGIGEAASINAILKSPAANIITILTRSYAEIKATRTLPPEFPLAQQLLSVQECIRVVMKKIEQSNVDKYVCTAIEPAVLRCLDNASTLRQTLDEVNKWPSSGDTSDPYFQGLRVQGAKAAKLIYSIKNDLSMVAIDLESEEAHKIFELSRALEEGDKRTALGIATAAGASLATDSQGRTLLHVAVGAGSKDIVQALLDADADPNTRDRNGSPPLFYAAGKADDGHLDIVRMLLEVGADVNAVGEHRGTALHIAISESSVDMVKLLLECGANPTIISADGETPESLARKAGGLIAKLLSQPPPLQQPMLRRKSIPAAQQDELVKPKPDHKRQAICEYFHSLFWSPRKAEWKPRIWDLIYNDETSDEVSEKLAESPNRWIHLPFNYIEPRWINDLIQNVLNKDYSSNKPEGLKLFQRATAFVDKHFNEREGARKVELESNFADQPGRFLSLVVPTLDVDFEDNTKLELCEEVKRSLGQGVKPVEHDISFLRHIQRIDEVAPYLHFSRSLYSSAGNSSELWLKHRIQHQALCLHLQKLEGSNDMQSAPKQIIPKSALYQNNSSHFGYLSSLAEASPTSENPNQPRTQPIRRPSMTHTDSQTSEALVSSLQHDPSKLALRGLIVPQLWLLMMCTEDKWTIITAFPDRWDTSAEPSLLNAIRDEFNDFKFEDTSVVEVATQILLCCTNFLQQKIYLRKLTTISINNVFATSVAELSDALVFRYDHLDSNKSSSTIKEELITEVKDLKRLDDIIYEIEIIKGILNEQENIVSDFEGAMNSLFGVNSSKGANPYIHPAFKSFDRIGIEARRVRESLITLLDLKQRFATVEDARLTATQTTILIIFTIATVIFSPLLLAAAILALKIDGLPDSFKPGYVVKVCVSSLGATIVLITIFLVTYRIYTWYGDSAHKSVKTSKTYRIPAINLPKAFPGKRTDRKDAKPEEAPSGKTSQSTKKNQQVRFRLSRDGVSSNDLERGQHEEKVSQVATIARE